MTQLATERADKAAARSSLTRQETDALKIARDLARQAQLAPKKAPFRPDRTNRYLSGRYY